MQSEQVSDEFSDNLLKSLLILRCFDRKECQKIHRYGTTQEKNIDKT